MFSKELYELDKNTVLYMIDEMQEDLNKKEEALKSKDEELKNKDEVIQRIQDEKDRQIALMQQELAELRKKLSNT